MTSSQSRPEGFKTFQKEELNSREVAEANSIYRVLNGSKLLGLSTPSSDTDEMGIFIEPLDYVVGFKKMDHYKFQTQPDGTRAGESDTEVIVYSLRKFMALAMQGNPTVMCILFADPDGDAVSELTSVGRELLSLSDAFVSKLAIPRFRGYLKSQTQRFKGESKGHTPTRPELIEAYGYDTKYAMHALRLGYQGTEIMRTGKLSIPMEDWVREILIDVRNGSYTYDEVLDGLNVLEHELEVEEGLCDLPDQPDTELLREFTINAHFNHWKNEGM